MNKIQRLILKKQEEIRQIRKKQEEAKLLEQKQRKENPRRRGRKPLKLELLEKAWELGKTNPLPFVAFKVGISLRAMYRYGITRRALNKENAEKKFLKLFQAKNKN